MLTPADIRITSYNVCYTKLLRPTLSALAVAVAATPAQAQDVQGVTIHFNGYLTDLSGNAVQGLVDVQVRILDQPLAGNELSYNFV